LPVLLVFATVFTGFFHCPGKNSFCHDKNPTLPKTVHNLSTDQKLFTPSLTTSHHNSNNNNPTVQNSGGLYGFSAMTY